MTGAIGQAIASLKNYFANRFGPERVREEGAPQGLFPRLFFPRDNPQASRKRPAERLIEIELEITDDEDEAENPTWSDWGRRNHRHQPKRFRRLDQEDSSMPRDKYVTRGSGIPPDIQGLERQPWQFKFPTKKAKPVKLNGELNGVRSDSCSSTASVELSRGSLLKNSTPSTSTSSQSSSSQANRRIVTSQSKPREEFDDPPPVSRMEQMNTEFRNFQFSKTNNKVVEVVTIDDDNDRGSKKEDEKLQRTSLQSRNEAKIIHKKQSSPMKHKEKKSFANMLCRLGRGVVGGVDPMNSTIRLEERNKYADLVRKFDMKQTFGFGALQRSKVNKEESLAIYRTFNDASPKVTFRSRFDSPLSSSTPKLLERIALENRTRLFSVPTVPKSLAEQMKPPVIDLEKEDKDKLVNGLSPSSPSTSMGSSVDIPALNTSYADLDEALNASLRPTSAQQEMEKKDDNLELMSETSSKADDDSDIAILSESILNKYKATRHNSLALEQNLSPYVNKGWLDNLSTTYKENQKAREKQIREHLETIDVIQKESTLETDLRDRMRKKLTLTEIIVLEEPMPELPEITADMRQVIDTAKRPGRDNDVLATVFNIDVTRGDVKTLAPCKWLNDNVINIYMELIANRSKEVGSYPKVHVFTTFFYPKLLKEGYSNTLKRWTRKVDIFGHDLIFFPIHLGLHWCMACADTRNKTIKYYDSLGGKNNKCLHALLNYLSSEMKERKGQVLETEDWELENVEDIPMQQNGSDCGVFSCKFAEYLSRDSKLTFLQENMNYYRERMIYEIIKKDLLHP